MVPSRDHRKTPPLHIISGLALTLVMVLLYLTQPSLLVSLDNRLYDTFLGFLPPGISSDVPVIVDLDDRSLSEY